MATLAEVQSNIAKEIKVNSQGQGFVSIRGAARLCDVDAAGLSRLLSSEGDDFFSSKLGRKLAEEGFQTEKSVDFSKSGIPDTALGVIIEYYAFDAGKRCTDLALAAFRAFARIGIRVWLQKSTNWRPEKGDNVPSLVETVAEMQKELYELKQNQRLLEQKMITSKVLAINPSIQTIEDFADAEEYFARTFHKVCVSISEKKSKKILKTTDFSGNYILEKKEFLKFYGVNNRMKKEQLIRIFEKMDSLQLGTFNKFQQSFILL
jgi:hypothetical protein